MTSYIDGSLINGEQVQYTGTISKWAVSGSIIAGVFFCFLGLMMFIARSNVAATIGIVCGILLLLLAYLRIKSTELAITNKRIIAKFGFISRQTVELNINKVESIQVHQGIMGRIFNYGSLVISGGGNPQAPVPGISHPLEFRKAFMQAQDQAGAKATL
jgi:uncharacterized membrane protein YdbT with pleckstrin-like domain